MSSIHNNAHAFPMTSFAASLDEEALPAYDAAPAPHLPSYAEATGQVVRDAIATMPTIGRFVPSSQRTTNASARAVSFVLGAALTAPETGAGAILSNLIGSKIMGHHHTGYDFHGGAAALNYFFAGMAMAPVELAVSKVAKTLRQAEAPKALQRLIAVAAPVAIGAATGALGATLAGTRGEVNAQTAQHSAIAGAVTGAIFGGASAVLGSFNPSPSV